MEKTVLQKVSTCEFFKIFPICASVGLAERVVLIQGVKAYLKAGKDSVPNFSFLEPRDIKIAFDFFSLHGKAIRNIEIVNCRTVNNVYCTCFVGDYTASDEEFLKKILECLGAPPNTVEFSFFSQRDINLFAAFMLANSELLKRDSNGR